MGRCFGRNWLNGNQALFSMLFENRSRRDPKEVSHQLCLLKTWTKSFGKEKVKAVDGGI